MQKSRKMSEWKQEEGLNSKMCVCVISEREGEIWTYVFLLLHGESGPELGVISIQTLVEGINLAALGEMEAITPDGGQSGASNSANNHILHNEGQTVCRGHAIDVMHVMVHLVDDINVNLVRSAHLGELLGLVKSLRS